MHIARARRTRREHLDLREPRARRQQRAPGREIPRQVVVAPIRQEWVARVDVDQGELPQVRVRELILERSVNTAEGEVEERACAPSDPACRPGTLRRIVLLPSRVHVELGHPDRYARRPRLDLGEATFDLRYPAIAPVAVEERLIALAIKP